MSAEISILDSSINNVLFSDALNKTTHYHKHEK